MRKALITGVTGQDGAYLARFLLAKGYKVHGTHRRTSGGRPWRLAELGLLDHPLLELHEHDVEDLGAAVRLINRVEPNEIYHLAAQTYVAASFEQPMVYARATGLGALALLEATRIVDPGIRVYQASSSEMFGSTRGEPQSEATPFRPCSPYAVAKLFAYWSAVGYREAHGMFVASGILFNHESPLRDPAFVTRKITQGAARLALGCGGPVELGNLNARRDWGFAGDYVDGMWRLLQADQPDTVVLATGRAESVRHFATLAFAHAAIDVVWEGEDERERGVDAKSGRELVRVNPRHYRPGEVEALIGDPTRARERLGWRPTTSLEELCALMMEADLGRTKAEFRTKRAVPIVLPSDPLRDAAPGRPKLAVVPGA